MLFLKVQENETGEIYIETSRKYYKSRNPLRIQRKNRWKMRESIEVQHMNYRDSTQNGEEWRYYPRKR